MLDGKSYQLPINDRSQLVHGCTRGFDKMLWTIGAVSHDARKASVTLI